MVSELLPHPRRLSRVEAARAIAAAPGIVPLAIDHRDGGQVFFGDIETAPFREWQYLFTIDHLARRGEVKDPFTCPVDILDETGLWDDSLAPSGLIHHISRCGSTLTAKALARPKGHMMISQGGPLQRGFWAAMTDDFRRPLEVDDVFLRRLRNLVLAMTRRRLGDERRAFVKFISWNALYIDAIAAAFPDTPALFLYRDPVEVIASVKQETTAALVARGSRLGAFLTGLPLTESAALDDVTYLAACYRRYFETVLAAQQAVAIINYRDLNEHSFSSVVEMGLKIAVNEDDLLAMREQFRYHSKDDSENNRFLKDSERKRGALSLQEKEIVERYCADAMLRLDASSRNVFVQSR